MSPYKSNSRGVMVLINNTFEHEIGRIKKDPNGNFIIIELTILGKKITLVNLYGPNDDKPQFYNTIQQYISEFGNEHVVWCGDWNLVLNSDLDTVNYKNINNPRARNTVINIIDENGYVDVWRVLNDTKKKFTWRRLIPDRKQARLDFFIVSEDMFTLVHDSDIVPGYRTDHSGIILKIKLQENERGRGYWKFNNSLLKDTNYVTTVKTVIDDTINLYKINNNNNNNTVPDDNIQFTINDQLFLETLLIMIRGETIKYSSIKKKENMQEEIKLEKEILEIEENINNNTLNIHINNLNSLEETRNRLYEIRNKKMEGVLLRSRCRYEDLGEKPTKYFLNLESRNFTSKVISKLTNEQGEDFTDTPDILNYQKSYYSTLYSETINIDDTPISEEIGRNPRKLSDNESIKLEGEITYAELLTALKKMKNCKSPGNDGFTSEFFKFFWSDVGVFILRSLNYAYRTDSLSVTQKQGIITCIPKPNKSRHFLKNWRPISLLNVIYKLASSVIANRIKSVLDSIIHEDQKGFITGRFIGENVRLIYDVLFETKQQNIPGLLLSIDFQQAFDSVSWKFISKTLDYFNFGPSIKKWIKLFQNGAESCILQNGFLSEFFYLQRGCRQGDPISPYLFILCAEVLSLMMRKEIAIKRIDINDKTFLLSQYADDTQIFLNGSETSLLATLGILKKFYLMSGLKINEDKTKAL